MVTFTLVSLLFAKVGEVVVRLFSEGGDGRGCTSSTSGFVAEVESELKLGVGRPQFAIEASSRRRGKSLCMLSARTPKRQKRIIGATAPGGAGVQFRIAIRGAVTIIFTVLLVMKKLCFDEVHRCDRTSIALHLRHSPPLGFISQF